MVATQHDAPDEGAWLVNCRRCDEMILSARVDQVPVTLSRISIPLSAARVLATYTDRVYNIWHARRGLMACAWYPPNRPSRGRLYTVHICGRWL